MSPTGPQRWSVFFQKVPAMAMEADHGEQARSAIKYWISKNMCLVWGDSTVWWEADLDSNCASAAYSKTTPSNPWSPPVSFSRHSLVQARTPGISLSLTTPPLPNHPKSHEIIFQISHKLACFLTISTTVTLVSPSSHTRVTVSPSSPVSLFIFWLLSNLFSPFSSHQNQVFTYNLGISIVPRHQILP